MIKMYEEKVSKSVDLQALQLIIKPTIWRCTVSPTENCNSHVSFRGGNTNLKVLLK